MKRFKAFLICWLIVLGGLAALSGAIQLLVIFGEAYGKGAAVAVIVAIVTGVFAFLWSKNEPNHP